MIKIGRFKNGSDKSIFLIIRNELSGADAYFKINGSNLNTYSYEHFEKAVEIIDNYNFEFIEDSNNLLWKIYKTIITNLSNPKKIGVYGTALSIVIELLLDDNYRRIIMKFREKYKFNKDLAIINKIKMIQEKCLI